MTDLRSIRRRLDTQLAEHRTAVAVVDAAESDLFKAQRRVENCTEAQRILQQVAEAVQTQANARIASVVSRCLEAVFEENAYEFRFLFEQKRGKTEATPLFVRDGYEMEPTNAAGGGCIDVAAFALRVACLVMARPALRRVLVLDEPVKHLSANYRPRFAELMLTLAKELGVQFLISTHFREFHCGKVIDLGDE